MNLYRMHVFADKHDENAKWFHGRGAFVVAGDVMEAVGLVAASVGAGGLERGYEIERKAKDVRHVETPCLLAWDPER